MNKNYKLTSCLGLLLLVLCVWVGGGVRAEEGKGEGEVMGEAALQTLLEERIKKLPAVEMVKAEAEVIRQRSVKMGTLQDPALTVEVMGLPWDTFRLNQTPMSGVQVGLTWTLPWPGMRASEVHSEQMMAEGMLARGGEAGLGVEVEAAQMYWQVHTLDRMLEVLVEVERQLKDMQRLAEARYRFGTAMEADVLRAGLALSDLGARRVEMLAMRAEMVAKFNGMLGRPSGEVLVPEAVHKIVPLSTLPGEDELLAQAQQTRPVFGEFEVQERVLEAKSEAAEYGRYPMLMVGVNYTFRMDSSVDGGAVHGATPDRDGGVDFLGAMVGVTLPFFSGGRVDAEQAALLAERHVTDIKRQETAWMLRAEIGGAVAVLRGLEARLEHLEGVLKPDARSAFDTLVAVYPTGGSDFMDLLAAAERLIMLDMQRAQWTGDHHRTRDRLVRLTNREQAKGDK